MVIRLKCCYKSMNVEDMHSACLINCAHVIILFSLCVVQPCAVLLNIYTLAEGANGHAFLFSIWCNPWDYYKAFEDVMHWKSAFFSHLLRSVIVTCPACVSCKQILEAISDACRGHSVLVQFVKETGIQYLHCQCSHTENNLQ